MFCIIGPTAIGKSQYAIDLAQSTNGEIISADAFQVYRHMDIGTAKVSPEDQVLVPHHLIDIKQPDEDYSAHEFVRRANDAIADIKSRKKTPIICGGTGLYIRALLYGYTFQEFPETPDIRAKLEQQLAQDGKNALISRLTEIDPEMAKLIDPNNIRRVIRALELFETTGQRPSEMRHQSEDPRPDCTIIGLTAPRDTIYDRINQRVEIMYKTGLIEEVKSLLKHYPPNLKAFKALGYAETIDHLLGRIDYEEMIKSVKQNTRRFAKRQLTWFRKFNNVDWKEIL